MRIKKMLGSPDVKGSFDGIDGLEVFGWAWDANHPDRKLQVEVLESGRLIARGKCDQFRDDLPKAGIGNGSNSFRLSLPAELCDGEEHEVEVRVAETGTILKGSPRSFVKGFRTGAVFGNAWLEGGTIVGWCPDASGGQPVEVELLESGQVIGTAIANQPDPRGGHAGFRAQLPAAVLDGRPHHFIVSVKGTGLVVGEIADITPYILTPEDALRRYGGQHIRSYLFPSARYRYESLQSALQQFAREIGQSGLNGDAAYRLNQVVLAHRQVVQGFGDAADKSRTYDPLRFTRPENPKVSIVMPVHNKFPVTYNGLASLILAPNKSSFEIIVVDDGSTDETADLSELVRGIEYVRHDGARGFVRSCNHGAQLARGEYVVMLNNDIEATAGWLDELLYVFEHYRRVGLVGAKLLYPNGTLQEAGGIVWNNGDPWNYGRNGNPHDPRYNYVREVDYVSGACIMLPRNLWDQLGGFDDAFVPAYFEDTDLAFRVRAAGYRTAYTPFSQIIHFEGVSSGTSTQAGIKKYQEVNRPIFKGRWMQACRHNGVPGKDPDLAKDRNFRFRVLVIDAATPQPDRDAGSYAAIQEIQILQSLGFKATFAPDNMAYLGEYTEALQRMGVECVFGPFYSSVNDVIARRGAEFDVFYITRYFIAERFVEAIRKANPGAKIVFNNADLHFLREMRSAIATKSKELKDKAVKTRDAELGVMRKVDLVLSYNEVEHAVILSHNMDSSKVAKCPWIVDIPEIVPGFDQRKDIAFLGGFAHHPNVEAVEFFVERVMPLLRKVLPGARFLIYGSHVPKKIEALACDDVVIGGWVPSVADVYDTCRVFVAPLLSGAGLKGKVAGALGHGVPCVLSPVAAEGIGVRDGLEVSIAREPKEWVAAIRALDADEARWQAYSDAARKFARDEFGFERGRVLMKEALGMVEVFCDDSGEGLVAHP